MVVASTSRRLAVEAPRSPGRCRSTRSRAERRAAADVRPYRNRGSLAIIEDVERELDAWTELPVDYERARAVLVGDASELVERAAYPGMAIEAGSPVPRETSVTVELWWRATGFERLFPIFEGELELTAEGSAAGLHLRGYYVVPLGAMGRFGDGLVGRRVARRTAAGVIEAIASRIVGEIDRRQADRPPSQPVDPHTMVRDRETF